MKLTVPDESIQDCLAEKDEAVFRSALAELDISAEDGRLLVELESLRRAFDIYFERVLEVHC